MEDHTKTTQVPDTSNTNINPNTQDSNLNIHSDQAPANLTQEESENVSSGPKKKFPFKVVGYILILILILSAVLVSVSSLIGSKPTTQKSTPHPASQPEITPQPIQETPSSTPTTEEDFSKWETWIDPIDFKILYPPRATMGVYAQITRMTAKTDSGDITLSFCKNCTKVACEGVCDNTENISIKVADKQYNEQEIWPNVRGNRTFRVVIAYPGTYIDNRISIIAEYPSKDSLKDVQTILSTFDFTKKPTPIPGLED